MEDNQEARSQGYEWINLISDKKEKLFSQHPSIFHWHTLQITVLRLTWSVSRRKQTESEFWKKVTKTFQKTVSFSWNIEFMKDDTQITIWNEYLMVINMKICVNLTNQVSFVLRWDTLQVRRNTVICNVSPRPPAAASRFIHNTNSAVDNNHCSPPGNRIVYSNLAPTPTDGAK